MVGQLAPVKIAIDNPTIQSLQLFSPDMLFPITHCELMSSIFNTRTIRTNEEAAINDDEESKR